MLEEATEGLTDCHAHLGDAVFDADREAVIARAKSVGLSRVIVVGETLADAESNWDLVAASNGFLQLCAGLYPTVLDLEQAEQLEQWIRSRRDDLVGIGEVGLDLWKVQDVEEQELQRRIFARFVRLAKQLELPLNVHSRSAGRQTIELLIELGARRVLMHAFDGRAAKAKPGLEAGFYFSVPPSVRRSAQKQKLVKQLPLERILLETDSPVLGETRGERNEPARVITSLQAIAELKGLDVQRVASATIDNAQRLFG